MNVTTKEVHKPGSIDKSALLINDASQLNPTPVFRHWIVRPDENARFIANLRNELKLAAAARRPLAAAGARHSMGGQSIPNQGTAITLNNGSCELNTSARTYFTSAGTRWSEVITKLGLHGFSPKVMQSNADFSVGGSLSVNAHGWAVPFGPIGTTVKSVRLMLADGTIVQCSRTENRELFIHTLGGYGLLGIILDAEIEMVPNSVLDATHINLPSAGFAVRFVDLVSNEPGPQMAYGRFSVARRNLFQTANLVTYHAGAKSGATPLQRKNSALIWATRSVYRAQTGSELGKRFRWFAETTIGPKLVPLSTSRNLVLGEPVANLAEKNTGRTDILHEYFVAPEQFDEFIAACREIIPLYQQDCLNVTLRFVEADADSVLAYAPSRRIAAVMAFSQKRTPEAEVQMRRMTEALIDHVLDIGGSFYLPYRLHARRDQFERAYSNAPSFAAFKRHCDPELLFRNALWDAYFN